MTQLHWLEVSEYASLSLSTIGIVTAAVTQQIVYALAPLTLTIGLNIANRERLKYLNQQQHIRAVTKLDLLIDPLRQRLENFDTLTRKLTTTTEQQIEQLRNNQQYSIDVFTQRLTKLDGLTQQLSKTTTQQIQELQHNQQQKNADAFNEYLTQFDALAEQLSTNTQKQIDPLNLHLTRLDALTQKLSRTTEQHTQELQRYRQEHNLNDIRQHLARLDTLTQRLSTDTYKQIEELKSAIAQIQTELQVLNLSLRVDEQNSPNTPEIQANTPAPRRTQQTTSATKSLPVVLTPEQIQQQSQSNVERSPDSSQNPQVEEPINSLPERKNSASVPQLPNPSVTEETQHPSQSPEGETTELTYQRNGSLPPAIAHQNTNSKSVVPISPQIHQTNSTPNSPPTVVGKNSSSQPQDKINSSPTTPTSELIKPNLTFKRSLKGHTEKVMSVAFSPDGVSLVSGSHDTTLKIWNLATNQARTFKGHRESPYFGGINSVAFSPDGKTVASGGNDKTIKLWDVLTGKEICTFTGHAEKVYSIVFSPDGKILASGSKDRTIKLWSIEKYKGIYTIPGHSDEVLCVAFSLDGKILASGGATNDQTIKIWYLAENKFLTLKGHSDLFGGINSVAFSPDGKTLASGSKDKTIKLWQLSNGKEIRTLVGHSDSVCSVTFSPDGKTLASGSKDRTIKLWQVDTGKELLTFTGSEDPIYCVAFSPDGKTLASGNGDKTITLLPFL
jgi:WD40 repeat protein